jgi:hypothetical protein
MITAYAPTIELGMRKFSNTLSEKDKRRYAGIEALKLGHGGIAYIANVLDCSEKTVSQGVKEIKRLSDDSGNEGRIRKKGGGRKRYDETCQGIDEKFLDVVKDHTAGDPMDETAVWTNLTQQEIVDHLNEKHGIKVSRTVIWQLHRKHDYRRRKAQKKQEDEGDRKQRRTI